MCKLLLFFMLYYVLRPLIGAQQRDHGIFTGENIIHFLIKSVHVKFRITVAVNISLKYAL